MICDWHASLRGHTLATSVFAPHLFSLVRFNAARAAQIEHTVASWIPGISRRAVIVFGVHKAANAEEFRVPLAGSSRTQPLHDKTPLPLRGEVGRGVKPP
jgi:hypothetical protein